MRGFPRCLPLWGRLRRPKGRCLQRLASSGAPPSSPQRRARGRRANRRGRSSPSPGRCRPRFPRCLASSRLPASAKPGSCRRLRAPEVPGAPASRGAPAARRDRRGRRARPSQACLANPSRWEASATAASRARTASRPWRRRSRLPETPSVARPVPPSASAVAWASPCGRPGNACRPACARRGRRRCCRTSCSRRRSAHP
mmetsp:Transcript_52481/g.152775  ORF Transcript_52481/g.152775 Transcript_52481/m.152775 type:complete len:200 (-) Transcript_52481:738-1337(-)